MQLYAYSEVENTKDRHIFCPIDSIGSSREQNHRTDCPDEPLMVEIMFRDLCRNTDKNIVVCLPT